MKSVPHAKWIGRFFYVLILLLVGYGYYTERAERIESEEKIRKLVILQDHQLGEYNDLLGKMTLRQIRQHHEMENMQGVIMYFQRSIYEMYNELRKYKKELPPWGGEKPMNPDDEDKWINNDA